MNIVLDVDAVVADLHTEWYKRYNMEWADNLDVSKVSNWHIHEFVKEECGLKVYDYLLDQDLYCSVKPVEGALAGVQALREHGHNIIFATTCTFGMVDQKAKWLLRHGFVERNPSRNQLPKDMIVVADKTLLAGWGHILIDDAPHHIEPWVKKSKKAILFEYPYNRHMLDDQHSVFWSYCARVTSWDGILNKLNVSALEEAR